MAEYLVYLLVRVFAAFVRFLPLSWALAIGRLMGTFGYYADVKHKSQAYANIKVAFSKTKTANEIKKITKGVFQNFGQGLIELLRIPLITHENFKEYVHVEGKEHVAEALKKNKGVILLVMHFGSWELASLSFSMLGSPYKVVVKPQKKFKHLDNLLNSYRSCRGQVVVSRGVGTREVIKGLKNNEIVAMVADQGGRDGVLVPFLGRRASMSVGAMRMALKLGAPVCFSIIIRQKGGKHRLLIHKPLALTDTGNIEKDVAVNLAHVAKTMEQYIKEYPSEYMWFYKIWKYSNETSILILNDGRTGHLRQSQAVAKMITAAVAERKIQAKTEIVRVQYKNKLAARAVSFCGLLTRPFFHQGRLEVLRFFLTKESHEQVMSTKADYIVSCGSSVASLNYLLSCDHCAKSVAILKPGLLNFKRFDLVVLPQHDNRRNLNGKKNLVFTQGAPNLVDDAYLKEQSELFLKRFNRLEYRQKFKIGFLLGGNTKHETFNENRARLVVKQIQQAAHDIDADILVTTSRRTPPRIESIVRNELKGNPRCQALIIANKEDVPEAVGGILGLSDALVVSGDSISMVSEAASSGKNTVVFSLQDRKTKKNKHNNFLKKLNEDGCVLLTDPKNIEHVLKDLAKNKMHTKPINDNETIFQAVRQII